VHSLELFCVIVLCQLTFAHLLDIDLDLAVLLVT